MLKQLIGRCSWCIAIIAAITPVVSAGGPETPKVPTRTNSAAGQGSGSILQVFQSPRLGEDRRSVRTVSYFDEFGELKDGVSGASLIPHGAFECGFASNNPSLLLFAGAVDVSPLNSCLGGDPAFLNVAYNNGTAFFHASARAACDPGGDPSGIGPVGVWARFAGDDQLTEISRVGFPAPDSSGNPASGMSFRDFHPLREQAVDVSSLKAEVPPLALNSSGVAAFVAEAQIDFSTQLRRGIWVHDATRTLRLVAKDGDAANVPSQNRCFSAFFPPSIDSSGRVYFKSEMLNCGGGFVSSGVFRWQHGLGPAPIAFEGLVVNAPAINARWGGSSVVFSGFLSFDVYLAWDTVATNAAGDAAFVAYVSAGSQTLVDSVWRYRASTGTLELVAFLGQSISASDQLWWLPAAQFAFGPPVINDRGDVAFVAGFASATTSGTTVMYAPSGGSLTELARTGDFTGFEDEDEFGVTQPLPLEWIGVYAGTTGQEVALLDARVSLNNFGHTAFYARLNVQQSSNLAPPTGLFVVRPGQPVRGVAYEGRVFEFGAGASLSTPDVAAILCGIGGQPTRGDSCLIADEESRYGIVAFNVLSPNLADPFCATYRTGGLVEAFIYEPYGGAACGGLCRGDIAGGPGGRGDGIVDQADLSQLLGAWGPCGAPCCADLTGDGLVNSDDLTQLLGSWGQNCSLIVEQIFQD